MKVAIAKELIQRTPNSKCRIIKDPNSGKWKLIVMLGRDWEPLISDRGKERYFKTIDAAVNTAIEIGFNSVTIENLQSDQLVSDFEIQAALHKAMPSRF